MYHLCGTMDHHPVHFIVFRAASTVPVDSKNHSAFYATVIQTFLVCFYIFVYHNLYKWCSWNSLVIFSRTVEIDKNEKQNNRNWVELRKLMKYDVVGNLICICFSLGLTYNFLQISDNNRNIRCWHTVQRRSSNCSWHPWILRITCSLQKFGTDHES